MLLRRTRLRLGCAMTAVVALLVTSCGNSAASGGSTNSGSGLEIAKALAEKSKKIDIQASTVDSIAAQVPKEIRKDGKLFMAHVAGQYPPIGFSLPGSSKLIGFLPDMEELIAGVLGLEPKYASASFEGAFLGISSGKYELLVSQVSVTHDRMEKYDMATFAQYKFALVASVDSSLTIDELTDLSGLTVAAKPGTFQYTLLKQWNRKIRSQGFPPMKLQGYAKSSGSRLALQSGRIDLYLTIGAVADYKASLEGSSTRVVAHWPGLKGTSEMEGNFIATLTQKGNGMAQAVCAAINHLIKTGAYAKLLQKWGLEDYGIEHCVVNPDVSR